ncbi:MAG: hypothetical protein SFX18_16460 [Pirellulales bacterium]|nr:hypothetical protein [Pirellulales bacterium]
MNTSDSRNEGIRDLGIFTVQAIPGPGIMFPTKQDNSGNAVTEPSQIVGDKSAPVKPENESQMDKSS